MKLQYGMLPKNERFFMRTFAAKGFEYCRCWSNTDETYRRLDAQMFGIDPLRMNFLMRLVIQHLTGAEVIPALKKRRVVGKKT